MYDDGGDDINTSLCIFIVLLNHLPSCIINTYRLESTSMYHCLLLVLSLYPGTPLHPMSPVTV